MFERLIERAEKAGEAAALRRAAALAARLRAEVPERIEVRVEDGDVRIEGRALLRRAALEPAMRWVLGRFE